MVNHRRKTSLHLAQPLLLSLVLPLGATLGQGDHYLAPLVDAHLVLLLAQEPLGLQLQQLDPLLPLPRLRSALHPPLHLEPLWRCRTLSPPRLVVRLLVVVLSAHPGQVLLVVFVKEVDRIALVRSQLVAFNFLTHDFVVVLGSRQWLRLEVCLRRHDVVLILHLDGEFLGSGWRRHLLVLGDLRDEGVLHLDGELLDLSLQLFDLSLQLFLSVFCFRPGLSHGR